MARIAVVSGDAVENGIGRDSRVLAEIRGLVDRHVADGDTRGGEPVSIARKPVAGDRVARRPPAFLVGKTEPPVADQFERHDGHGAVAELDDVFRRQPRPLAVVDAHRRGAGAGVDVDGDEREVPPSGEVEEPRPVLEAVENESVDEGALDVPRRRVVVMGRDEGEARPPLVADVGDPGHEQPVERVAGEDREPLRDDEADRVDLARPEQAALRVRSRIAEFCGRCLDALAHLLADEPRPVEDVRSGALGDTGCLRDIGQSRLPRHDHNMARNMNRFNSFLTISAECPYLFD